MTLPTPNSNFEETLSMSLQYYDASKISYIDYSVAALHIATRFTPTVRWTLRKAALVAMIGAMSVWIFCVKTFGKLSIQKRNDNIL